MANVNMNRLCKHGQAMQIPDGQAQFIRALDAQREVDKAIYGGGFLLSDRVAAEKAKAEMAADEKDAAERLVTEAAMNEKTEADRAAATKWPLSDRELAIIAAMGAEAAP